MFTLLENFYISNEARILKFNWQNLDMCIYVYISKYKKNNLILRTEE